MSAFGAMDISASGMTAQRLRTDVIAENIANVNTTRNENGVAYRRKTVVFEEKPSNSFSDYLSVASSSIGNGVKVSSIVEDTETAMTLVYDPSHPDANEEGYVEYPNVNTVTEMTNLIDASRAYEANVTAFNATKAMTTQALQIGK